MTARHRISDRNVLGIGIWDFDIVWNLSIVIWDFSAVFGKANRFYLNRLEADFDVSPAIPTPPGRGMEIWVKI
jgi:hypothetical protein